VSNSLSFFLFFLKGRGPNSGCWHRSAGAAEARRPPHAARIAGQLSPSGGDPLFCSPKQKGQIKRLKGPEFTGLIKAVFR
jgi:hypothetical protein